MFQIKNKNLINKKSKFHLQLNYEEHEWQIISRYYLYLALKLIRETWTKKYRIGEKCLGETKQKRGKLFLPLYDAPLVGNGGSGENLLMIMIINEKWYMWKGG